MNEATQVRHLVRDAQSVGPNDSLSRAVEVLRSASISVIPVLSGGCVLGVLGEKHVSAALVSGQNEGPFTVLQIMTNSVGSIQESASVLDASRTFADCAWDALPVVNHLGQFQGMVRRSDVAATLCAGLRPPVVGGMATPLGVLLTTGNLRAGASHFSLLLTGVTLYTTFLAMQWGMWVFEFWLENFSGVRLLDITRSWPLSVYQGQQLISVGLAGIRMLAFLLAIRLMPLAGYHGAEHKVVHAIERGEELTPEKVRPMPRPHPRCGTNLMVFLVIVTGLWSEIDHGLALLFGLIGWRMFGMKVQQYFTTREPTDKQLRTGIAAGKELLKRYNESPSRRSSFPVKLWNMGFPQILTGMMIVNTLQFALLRYLQGVYL